MACAVTSSSAAATPHDEAVDEMNASPHNASSAAASGSSSTVVDGKLQRQLPLAECLLPWLECFDDGKARWGLVTDVRADGSTYKRHGIIINISADITKAISAHDGTGKRRLRQLRLAIDLVKLALAVEPLAVKPLLLRRNEDYLDRNDLSSHNEELDGLGRGDVPIELHVHLSYRSINTQNLSWRLAKFFMDRLDHDPVASSDMAATVLRRHLVALAQQKPSINRLICLPVSVRLGVSSKCRGTADAGQSVSFFSCLATVSKDLHAYQRGREVKWKLETHPAPMLIQAISLSLVRIPVTKAVVKEVQKLDGLDIPVSCMFMDLDFRLIECAEDDLKVFFQSLTRHDVDLVYFKTGVGTFESCKPMDIYNQDHEGSIRTLLACIGRLDQEINVDLSGLFKLCHADVNRQAIICGMLEDLFSRDSPTSICLDGVTLYDRDARCIERQSLHWRREHPTQMLRLESMDISLENSSISPVSAFLRAIDDVKKLVIRRFGDETLEHGDVVEILQFPSLVSLVLEDASVDTIDIFDPSIHDPKIPTKPALVCLELEGLMLEDSESLGRFLERLDPVGASPSVLSTTLQKLTIAEIDPTDEFGEDDSTRLAVNDPVAVDVLRYTLQHNRVLQFVNFFGDFGNVPVRSGCSKFPRPAIRSYLPAPTDKRRSDIFRARNAAFLSVMRDDVRCSTLSTLSGSLDAALIQLIFDYSAPHVTRTIRV